MFWRPVACRFGGGGGGASPPPVPPVPPAAPAPTFASSQVGAAGATQRAKAGAIAGGFGGTDLTGPAGLVDPNKAGRSLLG